MNTTTDTQNLQAEPRFCRDCQHVRYAGMASTCRAPELQRINLISGPMDPHCARERLPRGGCGLEAKLFLAKQGPAVLAGEQAGALNKFAQAALRCTTPVDDSSLQIGMAFDSRDGEVLRLRLSVSDAAALCESTQEYLKAHLSRVHSLQSPGIPSVDVATPEDGVKVYPPLMSSTACSGDM